MMRLRKEKRRLNMKEKGENMTNIQWIPDDVFSKYNEKGFSVCGTSLSSDSAMEARNLDDPRNTLFREFAVFVD